MRQYLKFPIVMPKSRVPVKTWAGTVAARKQSAAEMHALRAEMFAYASEKPDSERKFDEELALAQAADPANPLMLALSRDKPDAKIAVERHPEDYRSWLLWFDQNEKDLAAIRKAAALAPDNAQVLSRLALAEQEEGFSREAVEHAERAAAISPAPLVLHALAVVYDKNGRCSEATSQEERAIEALPDRVDARVPAILRLELTRIAASCGKGDVIGTSSQTVEAEPVLRMCRQPLAMTRARAKDITAQFTIREDGSVTAVAILGKTDDRTAGVLRQFVESCGFEPVMVEGKPRRVQLNLTLDAFMQ